MTVDELIEKLAAMPGITRSQSTTHDAKDIVACQVGFANPTVGLLTNPVNQVQPPIYWQAKRV